jgi:hypothetical protein
MAATILFIVLALAGLLAVFVAAYLIKGLKFALIATALAFVAAVVLYFGMAFIITQSM